jgi:hypothetical protein
MSHPSHAYIVEPIPSDKLADFIKMFYWQSFGRYDDMGDRGNGKMYKKGLAIADCY